MSYEASDDYTIFSYIIATLFTRVKNRSLQRVKLIKDPADGKNLWDEMAMTNEEEADFEVFCERAGAHILTVLSALCKDVEDAYSFEPDSSTTPSLSYTLELPTYWDDNLSNSLDMQIETKKSI